MKEAWQYQSPLVYVFVRRIELIGWVFRDRIWHSSAKWTARVRAILLILRGHETEICCICGGKVGLVWRCEDKELWARLTGWQDGDGVSCIHCFDRLAENAKVFLQWSCTTHSL